MTTPKSRLAYGMHFDILDRAMTDDKGIRVKMTDHSQAWRLRLELHHARSIDRDDNRAAYAPGHKLHGCSVYDQLLVTIEQPEGEVWLYIHKRSIDTFHIEDLSAVTEAEPPAAVEEPEELERRA